MLFIPSSPADARGALSRPAYRADVDGLRAVAVLAVLGFHAFPTIFPGGFVGVDIFFVISGFLISTIIFENTERGSFSFREFYFRRIRRIFPALILVLAFCLVFGWFFLLRGEYEQLGKHTAAGAGFVLNIVLRNESGYFDNFADTKPLLHLWSLAVEEQYYLIWPVLVWFAHARRVRLFNLIAVLGVGSFVLNVFISAHHPVEAFYFPYTRFWEFLIGAVLALAYLRKREMPNGRTAEAVSLAGLGLIVGSVFALSRTLNFPGWWALLPATGAGLVISAGPASSLNRRLLSTPLLVWVGLISYPLYLWHWPLLSFARILSGEQPALGVRAFALALSFGLAWLTYRFFESPLRFGGNATRKVAGLSAAMLAVGLAGYACFASAGFPLRPAAKPEVFEKGDIGAAPFFAYMRAHFAPCEDPVIRAHASDYIGMKRCFQSKPGAVDVALIGDSHAEQWFVGLAEALPANNIAYAVQTGLPTFDHEDVAAIYRRLSEITSIRTVIVAGLWAEMFKSSDPRSVEDELSRGIQILIDAGKKVYLMSDNPRFPFSPTLCKFDRPLQDRRCTMGVSDPTWIAGFAALERMAARTGAKIIDTRPYFCGVSECSMEREGVLLYRDEHHFNIDGSKYAGRRLGGAANDIAQPAR